MLRRLRRLARHARGGRYASRAGPVLRPIAHVLRGAFGWTHPIYFIPGPGDAIEPGRRQLNWVWYVSVPDGPELERLLTDGTGKLHGGSVPAGMVAAKLIAQMHAVA